jgi:hypothetical protein
LVSKHLYDSAASTLQLDVSLDADVGTNTAVVVSDVITGVSTVLSVSLDDDDICGSVDGSLVNLR